VDGDNRVGRAEAIFPLPNLASAGGATLAELESDHPYNNNEDREWIYTLPGNPAGIDVTFDGRTEVESDFDYIHIADGSGTPIEGSPFTGYDLADRTLHVPGDTVKITLQSDESIAFWGFRVADVSASP